MEADFNSDNGGLDKMNIINKPFCDFLAELTNKPVFLNSPEVIAWVKQRKIEDEIEALESFIRSKANLYDTLGEDYNSACRRLCHLKNPQLAYKIKRMKAIEQYMRCRGKGCQNSYMSWLRFSALAELKSIKEYFKEIL